MAKIPQFSVAVLIASVAFGQSLWASPQHIKVPNGGFSKDAATCTFPDGTSPARVGIHCYDPQHFLPAYGIDQLHRMGFTGKGQTIILADSYGSPTLQADLDHFSDTFGLPHKTIKFIWPNGEYVNDLSTSDQVGWAEETTLDLEWSHAVAPDAELVAVITSTNESTGLNGFPDLFKGIEMASEQYPGAILSMSLGTGEPTFLADDVTTYLKGQFHDTLKKAAKAGMTILASSGDSGSTEINADQSSLYAYPDASYPAADPYITAVGGTSVQSGWAWAPEGTADDYWACKLAANPACPTNFMASTEGPGLVETVWKEDWALAAGGGGVSTLFDAPKYQSKLGADMQKVLNGHRGLPDVSLNAAVNGGVMVYLGFTAKDGSVKPSWTSFGGTSCASPETAGIVAIAGQVASMFLGKNVGIGYLNPILYSLRNEDFRDITTHQLGANGQVTIGDNSLFFSPAVLAAAGPTRVPPVAVPGYPTLEGYDLSTGRGVPQAVPFVFDVAWGRAMQGWR